MTEPRPASPGMVRLQPLREMARLFLRLGATAFGGPAAHIAMMEEEVVRRRQWLAREEFLDVLGATNLIPGPNSTEIANLLAAGALVAGGRARREGGRTAAAMLGVPGITTLGTAAGLGASYSRAVLFGSGYVLLAFLRADFVTRLHWLTEAQLLDAMAVGQVTPGPVLTTATFVGYLLGGTPGAIVATLGIFLPAFLFVAASGPLVPRLRRSRTAGAFFDGVNVGSLALMAVVTWHLGRAAIVDIPTVLLAGGSAALLFRFRLRSIWLVGSGGAIGQIARGSDNRPGPAPR